MGYTRTCVVCGRASWMLDDEDKCEECAKFEKDYIEHYVVKLDFINPNYTKPEVVH
jgi:hypothetical protein